MDAAQPDMMDTVLAFPNLTFVQPVYVTHAGDGLEPGAGQPMYGE